MSDVHLAYLRGSTAKQEVTIEVQREQITARCPDRKFTFVDDPAQKSATIHRPGLQRCLQLLARKEAASLTVYKVDRLSRSLEDFARLVRLSREQGWELHALDAPVDVNTPAGEMFISQLAVFAQFERRLIGQRTKEGLARKKAEGVRIGRPRSVPTCIREEIVTRRQTGDTLVTIAADLNRRGVPTGQGAPCWTPGTVGALHRHERRVHA